MTIRARLSFEYETQLLPTSFIEEKQMLDEIVVNFANLLVLEILEHKNNDDFTFYLSLDNKVESM